MRSEKAKRQEMAHILNLFGDYIACHTCFDIVFSQKVGYIWLRIREGDIEGVALVDSVQRLLSFLFDEIVFDAVVASPYEHMEGYPAEEEQAAAKRRIAMILDHAGEERKKYLRLFDRHLKSMGDNALE